MQHPSLGCCTVQPSLFLHTLLARLLFPLNPIPAAPTLSWQSRLRLLQPSPRNLLGSHGTVLGLLLGLKEGRLGGAAGKEGVEEIGFWLSPFALKPAEIFRSAALGNSIALVSYAFVPRAANLWQMFCKVRLVQQKNTQIFLHHSFRAVSKTLQAI